MPDQYSFGLTNSAQIVNNIIVNETKITKGYPFVDDLLQNIQIINYDNFGNYAKFLNNTNEIIYEGNFKTRDTITTQYNLGDGIQAQFYVSVYVTGASGSIITPPNKPELYIDGIKQEIDDNGTTNYFRVYLDNFYRNQTIHIKASCTSSFQPGYQIVEEDFKITEEFLSGLIPTLLIEIKPATV